MVHQRDIQVNEKVSLRIGKREITILRLIQELFGTNSVDWNKN